MADVTASVSEPLTETEAAIVKRFGFDKPWWPCFVYSGAYEGDQCELESGHDGPHETDFRAAVTLGYRGRVKLTWNGDEPWSRDLRETFKDLEVTS
jgi:hypothetical protein